MLTEGRNTHPMGVLPQDNQARPQSKQIRDAPQIVIAKFPQPSLARKIGNWSVQELSRFGLESECQMEDAKRKLQWPLPWIHELESR